MGTMCELLGVSFNKPVRFRVSFKAFRRLGEYNPDGWGVAFYPDESAAVFKEPLKAGASELASFLERYEGLKSKIFVAHVRRASRGSVSYKNTLPFCRELFGRMYLFAHNGTLAGFERLELGVFKPVGETDSEHAFCHLLHRIQQRGVVEWRREDFDWLAGVLREINGYGRFNCIFSDGEHLFCYFDESGYNGMVFLRREPPYGKVRLADEDWEIDLSGEKGPGERGYIVATKKLTNERWRELVPGELIVFKDGKMVYSSTDREPGTGRPR
jgi:glutamine amidotransferase